MGCFGLVLLYGFAFGASAAAAFFYWVGSTAHWTSDGPGMLLIMIGLGVSVLVAGSCWSLVLADMFRPRDPEPPPAA